MKGRHVDNCTLESRSSISDIYINVPVVRYPFESSESVIDPASVYIVELSYVWNQIARDVIVQKTVILLCLGSYIPGRYVFPSW